MSEDFDSWLRPDERREEIRLSTICRIFLHVPVEEDDEIPQEYQEIDECETIDFSSNGVQVRLSKPLVQGAILPVFVDVNGESFSLICEVMWCREDKDSAGYLVGLHLLDSDDSSAIEWKEAMIRWLEADSGFDF